MILDLSKVEISDKPSVEESYGESTKKDVNVLEAKDGAHDTSVTRVNDFVQQVYSLFVFMLEFFILSASLKLTISITYFQGKRPYEIHFIVCQY